MRVYLTIPELETALGKELLELSVRIATDGTLSAEEINELRRWLKVNRAQPDIAAIPYLSGIMQRIAGDGVVDRDECMELFMAIERVIPATMRDPIVRARKTRESTRREQAREMRRVARENELKENRIRQAEEYALRMRVRHQFSKVAGVSFANEDGSERQRILSRCKEGERLTLQRDIDNGFSEFAIEVRRRNGAQLGYIPEYYAANLCSEIESGHHLFAIIHALTGATPYRPTRGVNILVVIVADGVSDIEVNQYLRSVEGRDYSDGSIFDRTQSTSQAQTKTNPAKAWWRFW